jgi:hypothetical protein
MRTTWRAKRNRLRENGTTMGVMVYEFDTA